MTDAPTVSIITVVLDDRDGLQATAESVLGQTGGVDVEWIIVDGGSTDGSAELASQLAADLPGGSGVYLPGPDDGIVHAMNRGGDRATGRYVQYLNAGDRWHSPTALATAVRSAGLDGPDAPTWAVGWRVVVDDRYRPVRPVRRQRYGRLRHAFHLVQLSHQATFVRRDCWHEVGRYRQEAGPALDFDLALRMGARFGAPRQIDSVLVEYLEGGMSQTGLRRSLLLASRARVRALRIPFPLSLLDRGYAHAFFWYSRARSLAKRGLQRAFGQRFLTWWASR